MTLIRLGLSKERLVRTSLLLAGTAFLVLGIVGILLPILPTTPFLLVSAACYARGSKRLYNWLLNNRLVGTYIRNYREGKGIRLRAKILALVLLWATITYSSFFVTHNVALRVTLLVIASAATIYILRIKTLRED
jgi:uncharacterized membrane protein YbaN (DUF454 family)